MRSTWFPMLAIGSMMLLVPALALGATPAGAALAGGVSLLPGAASAADEGSGSGPSSAPAGGGATSPASAPAGPLVVMVPTVEPASRKERFFGVGARARFVAVPNFVLGIIGLQDNLGTFQEGFALDLGYRSVRIEGGRKKGGLDIGLSLFYDDYRFSKKRGVPCSDFEMGGSRAGADPLNCSDYFDTGSPGSIVGGFFREDGDAPLETEYRLQNFRFVGGEITIAGWWALNPFFHLDLGAAIGGGAVLGKMVFFDTYEMQAMSDVEDRTPCATPGFLPPDSAATSNTGCAEVKVEEDSVPPALPSFRIWLGATFSIIKNFEIKLRGGIGGPSIFHADAGIMVWF